ncbi:MAG: hypothetical protein V3W41_21885 [Planctomycetota bacterium]
MSNEADGEAPKYGCKHPWHESFLRAQFCPSCKIDTNVDTDKREIAELAYPKEASCEVPPPKYDDGDITIRGGVGGRIGGTIRFELPNGDDFMCIAPDGTVTVRGRTVAHDVEAWRAFRQWLGECEIVRTASGHEGHGDNVEVRHRSYVRPRLSHVEALLASWRGSANEDHCADQLAQALEDDNYEIASEAGAIMGAS